MWSDDDLDALRRATAVTDAAKKQRLKFTRELIAKTQKEFRREKKVAEARGGSRPRPRVGTRGDTGRLDE